MRLDFERLFRPGAGSGFPRMPAIAGEAMVATSHPLATRAGLRALEQGGNAVDAALAAAAVLPVVEPNLNGLGGDCFAIVWRGGELIGLNGSGRSPAVLDSGARRPLRAALGHRSRRGRRLVRPRRALRAPRPRPRARATRPSSPSAAWPRPRASRRSGSAPRREGRAPFPAPRVAERYRLPELAATLRRVAAERARRASTRGEVARAIASVHLARRGATWPRTARSGSSRCACRSAAVEVCELPPNTQGAAALVALGCSPAAEQPDEPVERLHSRIEAVRAGLARAYAHVGDEPLPDGFLDLEPSRRGPPRPATTAGDTTYLCAVDADRMAVSLIQSTYEGFGSGLAAPGPASRSTTAAPCFVETEGHPNQLRAGQAPVPHDHPRDAAARRSRVAVRRHGRRHAGAGARPGRRRGRLARPRPAVGARPCALPRRLDDGSGRARAGALGARADELEARGHRVVRADAPYDFGVGQMILDLGESLVGGSDGRGDGYAGGL